MLDKFDTLITKNVVPRPNNERINHAHAPPLKIQVDQYVTPHNTISTATIFARHTHTYKLGPT